MKKLLTVLMAIPLFCGAKKLYVSPNGNNTTGLSPTTAWTSLKKLNTMWGSVNGDDSVLFERGYTYPGFIKPTTSGTPGHKIVFTSFGTGAKPILSGLYLLHGWISLGSNKWYCIPDSITRADVNILTIQDVAKEVARTPWMSYTSTVASSNTAATLTSSSITSAQIWTGGEVVLRQSTFYTEKGNITAQSGNTINFSNNTQPLHNGVLAKFQSQTSAGLGFFIQRHLAAMDAEGEWYYDKPANKMYLYTTVNPNTLTIKTSYVDTVINLTSRGYITIKDLQVEGANVYGVENYTGAELLVEGCTFKNNTRGIYVWNTSDTRIVRDTLSNSLNCAIFVSNKQARRVMVDSNVINNSGQLVGMGVYNTEHTLRGIVSLLDETSASNFNYIIGNKVINTGNCPIYFQGSNVIVRRNIVDTFANRIDDMGGIYTFIDNGQVNSTVYINRTVDSNFISNAIGAPLGSRNSSNVDVVGLYADDQSLNINFLHNTIWNIPGNAVQMNTPKSIWVRDNTVHNAKVFIDENKRLYGVISGVKVTKNIFVQTATTAALIVQHVNDQLNGPPAQTANESMTGFALMDSNWTTNLMTNSFQMITKPTVTPSSSYTTVNINWSTWRSTYTHDLVSSLPPITVTTTNTHIYVNPKNTDSVINFFGSTKQDMKGNVYNNTATIPKFSSLILIDNGSISNLPPTGVSAGADQTKTLPTNTATVTGTATDPEGAAISSLWTKTSGPSGGSITSPTSATTGITGLTQGVYQFTYKASDPLGAFSTDVMQITVNPPVNTAPTVNAGVDKEIGLPTNSVSVTGTASDAEGGALTYLWTHIGGTGTTWNIVSPGSLTTTINNLGEGTYDFDLAVTDNGSLTSHDAMHILVNPNPPPPNQYPVADAGSNIDITLPINYTTLNSSASYDPDGTIVLRTWSKVSGPSGGTLSSTTAISPDLTGLTQGVYNYQVVVKDNSDSIDNAIVTITVHPRPDNIPPTVNAGINQSIRLPVAAVIVVADTLDTDGYIATIGWSKVDGPTGDNIVSSSSKTTNITFTQSGVYNYRVTVTDDRGGSAVDDITITVLPAYIAPIIGTGGNILIPTPIDSVLLTGTAIDLDGTITTVLWTKTSGPASGTIEHTNQLVTKVHGLTPGFYTYQLSVTDNDGLTSTTTMNVTVYYPFIMSKSSVIGYKVEANTPNEIPEP